MWSSPPRGRFCKMQTSRVRNRAFLRIIVGLGTQPSTMRDRMCTNFEWTTRRRGFSSSLRQTARSLTPSVLNGSIIYLYRLKGSSFISFLCAWIFETQTCRPSQNIWIVCYLYMRLVYKRYLRIVVASNNNQMIQSGTWKQRKTVYNNISRNYYSVFWNHNTKTYC